MKLLQKLRDFYQKLHNSQKNRIRFRWVVEATQSKLAEMWALQFSDKFPRVRAFLLTDPEFNGLLDCSGRCPTIKNTQLEYGRTFPKEQIMAFAFPSTDYAIICIRENFRFPLDRDLEHEFRHIYLNQHKVWT